MATESEVHRPENHNGSLNKDKASSSDVTNDPEAMRSELKSFTPVLFETRKWNEVADEQVRSRLAELRGMAYDAEDVLDTYVTKTESSMSVSRALRKYFSASDTSKDLRKILIQMKDVSSKLDAYMKESATVGGTRGSQSSKGHFQADDEYVVGIEKDLEKLVQMLNGDVKGKASQGHSDVLAIVGMGGSGKTTLARFIYNHSKIRRHFKYLTWVSLSQRWNSDEVLSEICKQLRNMAESLFFWNRLWPNRCLIVLDDVWDCETLQNDLLPKLFRQHQQDNQEPTGIQFDQIKIIITSRHQHKPSDKGLKWFFHEVKPFAKDSGWDWELFDKVVSGTNNENNRAQEYRGLAMEMLKKCGGLPLAIVALGKLLKTKDTIQEWEGVFYQLSNKEGPNDLYLPVNDILAISYHDLKPYLKPCFLYFGLFPKDFLIKAGPLLKMWIAEGFVEIRDTNDDQTTSNTAAEYTLESGARKILEKLIEQTMVKVVKNNYNGKSKTLQVHDIMRDICIKEAHEIGFLTLCSSGSDQIAQNKSRRATVNLSKPSTLPVENAHLRSLFVFGNEGVRKRAYKGNQQEILNLDLVCEKFKLLRVLNIDGVKTCDGVMPKDIGNLTHLKYLRIRSTNIRELPKSIGKLRMLSTLDYWKVFVDDSGITLPNVLWKLSNLKHLYLPYELSNMEENFKLHPVQNLQTLWGIKAGDWMKKDMQLLTPKIKKLCIQGISSFGLMKTLFDSPVIKDNTNLFSLALDWYGFELKDLKALSGLGSLRKLRLMGKAPNHSNPLSFPSNLGKLELYYTQLKDTNSLDALGELQCLKYLRLDKDSYMGSKWIIKGEGVLFPQLMELKLINLPKLEQWEMVERGIHMPCLTKLTANHCTLLNSIPEDFYTRDGLTLEIKTESPTLKNRLQRAKSAGLADSDNQSKVALDVSAS